jgi:hypothetical protein
MSTSLELHLHLRCHRLKSNTGFSLTVTRKEATSRASTPAWATVGLQRTRTFRISTIQTSIHSDKSSPPSDASSVIELPSPARQT